MFRIHPLLAAAGLALAGVSPAAAAAAAATTPELPTVRAVEADAKVPVARIPDGVFLRTVNDPTDAVWRRLPEYKVMLDPAPPVHPSVSLLHDAAKPRRALYVIPARTAERLYLRLRWPDASRDTVTDRTRFRDGAAVQFAIGDATTSYIMGSGPEEPVNIWYWAADSDAVESLGAGGPGSSTRLEQQLVTGSGRYRNGDGAATGEWTVVMSRPINVPETGYQVTLDRAEVPVGFALWQGAQRERDGFKSVLLGWIRLQLAAE